MKRKRWVFACAILGVGLIGWLLMGPESRILRTHEFSRAVMLGFAPDGRLAVYGDDALLLIDNQGDVEKIPDSKAGGRPVGAGSSGAGGFATMSASAAGAQTRLFDWSGNELASFSTNTMLGQPAMDNLGNAYFRDLGGSILSLRPDGSHRWVYSSGPNPIALPLVSPPVSPDGRVAVFTDSGRALVVIDPEGGRLFPAIEISGSASDTTVQFASDGDLLVQQGTVLRRFALDGQVRWSLDLSDQPDVQPTSPRVLTSPIASLEGTTYCRMGRRTFAINDSGQLAWSFRHDSGRDGTNKFNSTSYLHDWWGTPMSEGRFIVTAGSRELRQVANAAGTVANVYVLARDERLVCLNADGTVAWEQSFPPAINWQLPRNARDWHIARDTLFGLRSSAIVSQPMVSADGTIYVTGWSNGKAKIWAIRGD